VLTELPSKRRQRIQIQVDDKAKLAALANLRGQLKQSAAEDPQVKHKLLMQLYVETCQAKIASVCEYVLDLVQGGCKFLVFGHHHAMLDALEYSVKGKNVKYIRIDGSVKASERHRQVKEFQGDDQVRVAILGLMAAGVGITLTAASTVVFAELHWTPGVLIQAEDRAHRIGQKSSVNIHYLIARETVDDVIWPSVSQKVKIVSTMCDGRRDRLVAGFSSATDAVESAMGSDVDDLVAALGAALEPEAESVEPDSAASASSQKSPGSALSRLRARVKSASHQPSCCSFYVSAVTGRIHILDRGGQPLGQGASFKLSDWEALWDHGTLPEALSRENGAVQATEVFLCQWLALKSSERRQLTDRMVTLPLPRYFGRQERQQTAAEPKRYKQLRLSTPGVVQRKAVDPSLCSWCQEAEPEHGSLFCSPSCEMKGSKARHSSFGKAFAKCLLAAVEEAGPYLADVQGVKLQVYPRADNSKSGDKLFERKCQWNDGWDVRSLVTYEGEGMSFRALKDKLHPSVYEEAQRTMAELRERISSAARQAVPKAKAAAIDLVLQSHPTASNPEEVSNNSSSKDAGLMHRPNEEVCVPEVRSMAEPLEAQAHEACSIHEQQDSVLRSHRRFRRGVLQEAPHDQPALPVL